MRTRLQDALAMVGREPAFVDVNLGALPPGDARLRFGSPTILVDGVDLFGQPPTRDAALSCRVYPGGLPTAAELATHLRF